MSPSIFRFWDKPSKEVGSGDHSAGRTSHATLPRSSVGCFTNGIRVEFGSLISCDEINTGEGPRTMVTTWEGVIRGKQKREVDNDSPADPLQEEDVSVVIWEERQLLESDRIIAETPSSHLQVQAQAMLCSCQNKSKHIPHLMAFEFVEPESVLEDNTYGSQTVLVYRKPNGKDIWPVWNGADKKKRGKILEAFETAIESAWAYGLAVCPRPLTEMFWDEESGCCSIIGLTYSCKLGRETPRIMKINDVTIAAKACFMLSSTELKDLKQWTKPWTKGTPTKESAREQTVELSVPPLGGVTNGNIDKVPHKAAASSMKHDHELFVALVALIIRDGKNINYQGVSQGVSLCFGNTTPAEVEQRFIPIVDAANKLNEASAKGKNADPAVDTAAKKTKSGVDTRLAAAVNDGDGPARQPPSSHETESETALTQPINVNSDHISRCTYEEFAWSDTVLQDLRRHRCDCHL